MSVAYITYSLSAQNGYGEAARRHIKALESVGIDPIKLEASKQVFWNFNTTISIYHILPYIYGHIWSFVNSFGGERKILYFAWETDKIHEEIVEEIDKAGFDEIWVPNPSIKEACFVAFGGQIPCYVIPHPMPIPEYRGKSQIVDNIFKSVGITPDDYIFLTISHYQPRKNIDGLIREYSRVARKNDWLIVKASGYRGNIDTSANVLIIDTHLPREALTDLLYRADCYISLSHAEGFGLEAANSVAMGKPVILSDVPGHRLYSPRESLVHTHKVPARDNFFKHHTPDQNWWEIDSLSAREKISKHPVKQDPGARVFSFEEIGELMKERIEGGK